MVPRKTSPVVPSIESSSPARSTTSRPAMRIAPLRSRSASASQPATQHLAHLPRDQRRVAGHAAARGEDALRGGHAADVLGRRLDAHQDHRLAARRGGLGVLGVEDDAAGGRAGTGVEALGEPALLLHGAVLLGRVEGRAQELVELLGLDAQQRLVRRRSAAPSPCRRRCGPRPRRCACRRGICSM